jgi:hypothetical protein
MEAKNGATLTEVLVAMGIVLTMLMLLVPSLWKAMNQADKRNEAIRSAFDRERVPQASWIMQTVLHDGHWWVQNCEAKHFVHHPDCPCRTPRLRIPVTAEQEGGE